MPVNKPELKGRTKRYTMQDYYDGKCSKEGFTLDTPGATSFEQDEAAKNAPPEQETTQSPDPTPEQPTAPQAAETEAAPTKGEPVGDAPDTEKSPDNTD